MYNEVVPYEKSQRAQADYDAHWRKLTTIVRHNTIYRIVQTALAESDHKIFLTLTCGRSQK